MAMHDAALITRFEYKRITSFVLIVALILFICDGILFQSYHIKTAAHQTLAWMYNNEALVLVLHILSMIVLTSFFLPPSLLVLVSGFIFQSIYIQEGYGLVIAWMASILGAAIGGTLAFSRAPRLSHELYEVLLDRYPILSVVETAIDKSPLRVMMLLRLNPLFPFGMLNYVFAVKRVDVALFIVAMSAVAQWYLFLVCVGAGFSNMYNGYPYIGYAIGASCGAVVMSLLWWFAKVELLTEVNQARYGKMKRPGIIKRLAKKLKGKRGRSRSRGRSTSRSRSASSSRSSTRNSNIVEHSDLSGAEYVNMQIVGEGTDDDGSDIYRDKLDMPEIVLDNFS